RAMLAGLAMMLVSACGGDATGPDDSDVTGTYALHAVGGATLPATVFEDATERIEFTRGSLTLRSDRRWTTEVTVRITRGSVVATEPGTGGGSWRRDGGALVLTDGELGDDYRATVRDGTLTVEIDGTTLEYRR
ncbi:MAG TPA: hypothetical protein VEA99_11145, partial [Gemmatimonadaceae bacterium]|nr:hypothetical protein [Gemmatimonadaceae bacterium]